MYQQDAKTNLEFNSTRSQNYRDAVKDAGVVWAHDMQVMHQYLAPALGETVLEVGAGSGFFSFAIADAVGSKGKVYVTDPSADQMRPIFEKQKNNMELLIQAAESIHIGGNAQPIDKIWSRGAFHHVPNKTLAMQRWRNLSSPKAKLVIFDIFTCNDTALFFDAFVAKACITGHEVAFMSKAFATSLCAISGWKPPVFHDIPLSWHFTNEDVIGVFLAKLLSNRFNFSPKDSLEAAHKYLGIQKTQSGIELNWPMTVMVSEAGEPLENG